MGAWQSLPDDLPPEVRHFVEQLRRLKDRTGLSLASLGARTAYSKSSWHRYLNATQPPPRQAVTALCRLVGLADADVERVKVRWELAVQAWPRAAAVPDRPGGAERAEEYEDDPTLPWWDTPPEEKAEKRDGGRLLRYAGLLLLLLLVVAVGGIVAFG
ncbi:transcriptional regulator with XRE-family HTH domain [Streptomyces canus]|jgi:transcriptional regulator with XRE-family HTH domain|uniref:helix-turn-helix domain-containing protein n=1 Tax=Streptomyces canus TaxID=58343 RepID=UPI00277E8D3A|nr:helix-turn-helix transcriptional regulator [Streptomyces canus]MDQ0599492.1 transcriptional regulator with XRE-family HTH domain [Streptomyces canus]